jgi:redox-sensitive bicupin YhaK (pirin superfamily)
LSEREGSQRERALTTVDIRRSADRSTTRLSWLDSRHSFSFGRHYDPANTHFGVLVASNHDVVAAGAGYDPHPHRDTEIISWVLGGALEHVDDGGSRGVVRPGLVQRTSAGSGIVHSERASGGEPVEFVQMWVLPDETGGAPDYRQADVTSALATGGLVPVASGIPRHRDAAALPILQRGAALHAARLAAGRWVSLPAAPYVHVYVPRGSVTLQDAGELGPGDAARITGARGRRLTAVDGAEILVWEMHADLGGTRGAYSGT